MRIHNQSQSQYSSRKTATCKKNLKYCESKAWENNISLTTSLQIKQGRECSKKKNYVGKNKKQSKTLYQSTTLQPSHCIPNSSQTISPSKIFQYRQVQLNKQSATKMSLKESVKIPINTSTQQIKRMNEIFTISRKSKAPPNKLISCENKKILQSYLATTHSSLLKQSQVNKKKAYTSVFGCNNEMIGNNFSFDKQCEIKQNCLQKILRQKQQQLQKQQSLRKEKKKLREYISKLDNNSKLLNPQLNRQQISEKQRNKTEIGVHEKPSTKFFESFHTISNHYKQAIGELIDNKIRSQKNINFIQQIKQHKKSRLKVRNQGLTCLQREGDANLLQINSIQTKKRHKTNQINFFYPFSNQNTYDGLLSITDRNKHTQTQIIPQNAVQVIYSKQSLKRRFINFAKKLIFMNYECAIFGVPKQRLYEVLWKQRTPFQLEGSYVFFKFIKMGNLDLLKTFVEQNRQYAYQVDNEGRSALIYAVQNNHLHIVDYLLSLGSNVNKYTNGGYSALYFGIKNAELPIVTCLLQRGASPWSTNTYCLKNLLNVYSKQINIVLKNARRLHVGCSLCFKLKDRVKLWQNFRHKLSNTQLFTFDT